MFTEKKKLLKSCLPVSSLGTTTDTINGELVQITSFEPTRKMSTYLLAFIVSDFDFIEMVQDNVLVIHMNPSPTHHSNMCFLYFTRCVPM